MTTYNQLILNLDSSKLRFEQAQRDYEFAVKQLARAEARLATISRNHANFYHWRDAAKQAKRDISQALEDGHKELAYGKSLFAQIVTLRRMQAGWVYRLTIANSRLRPAKV